MTSKVQKPSSSSTKIDVKEGEDPALFLKNYINYCRLKNVIPYNSVITTLQNQQLYPIKQLIVTPNINRQIASTSSSIIEVTSPPPSSTSFHALMTALLGCDPSIRGGPYRRLQQLRVWQCTELSNEEDIASSLVNILKNGGEEVQLVSLELINCGINSLGAHALGRALSRGFNISLTELKLDFNSNLGSEGMYMRL